LRSNSLAKAAKNAQSEDSPEDDEPIFRSDLPTDHLAGVFRNFSAYKKGREALLIGDGTLFLKICSSLRHGCENRRVAISECIRNIALDPATCSSAVMPSLIVTLTLPFAPGCELREGDETDMPLPLLKVAAEPSECRESSLPVRLACIESLRYTAPIPNCFFCNVFSQVYRFNGVRPRQDCLLQSLPLPARCAPCRAGRACEGAD
jgi:hypothetical protein